jgi:hypothetical protein
MSKQETIEEYLARGGVITKVPSSFPAEEPNKVNPTPTSGATMMSLAEGALYYSESKAKKERKVPEKTINFSALPANLLKYLPKRDS